MGREIRRVPQSWEHPKDKNGRFMPMHDRAFEEAAKEWWEAAVKWHDGDVAESDQKSRQKHPWYWQWDGNPPDEKYYRPVFTDPADCYQVYETISEGTPVTPVFASLEAMRQWMMQPIDRMSEFNHGEDWQCMQGMTKEQAESFCQIGFAPSFMSGPDIGLVAGHRFIPEKKIDS